MSHQGAHKMANTSQPSNPVAKDWDALNMLWQREFPSCSLKPVFSISSWAARQTTLLSLPWSWVTLLDIEMLMGVRWATSRLSPEHLLHVCVGPLSPFQRLEWRPSPGPPRGHTLVMAEHPAVWVPVWSRQITTEAGAVWRGCTKLWSKDKRMKRMLGGRSCWPYQTLSPPDGERRLWRQFSQCPPEPHVS